MTRSQKFIKAYSTKLENSADYFNWDTSLMKRSQFEKAKYKFLLILPCPSANKAVSSTAAVFNDYFCHYHPDWFIDFAWLPSEKDVKHFDANRLPYAIGVITHLDPSHFDAIGFSFSILHELLTVPVMVNSLSRCDKPIPLTWSERKDLKCDEIPLVLSGGISSPHADICFGDIGDGRISYLDAILLGTEEPLGDLIELHMKAREKGLTIQELYDECFSIPSFYQPQAYEVVYKDNVIVSNKKINPKAQDQVRPYYSKKFDKRLYTARTITPASGENAGTLQYMMSEGCAGKSNCNFCSEGWYTGSWRENSQENILWAAKEGRKWNAADSCKAMSFNTNFHSKFKSNLYKLRKDYKRVKFNNMRLNEMGHDFDQWHMMSYLGQTHFAAPIEGISDRIRNGILNKGLDKEVVDYVFDQLIGQPVSDIKVGVVFTGYEEDEDWEDLYNTFDKVNEKAKAYNKKYPMRLKFTGLVHYPGCLTENSLTPIKGHGLVRQTWFDEGMELPGISESHITKVAEPVVADCLEVEYEDGTVQTGTYNHPVLTSNDPVVTDDSWTKFENLQPGQTVFKKIGTGCFGNTITIHWDDNHTQTYDEDLASVSAMFPCNSTVLEGKVIISYEKPLLKFFSKKHTEALQKRGFDCKVLTEKNSLTTNLEITGKRIVALVKSFKHDKLPDWLMLSSASVQMRFISAFWRVVGKVEFDEDGVAVCSMSITLSHRKNLLLDLKAVLANMGFDSVIREDPNSLGTHKLIVTDYANSLYSKLQQTSSKIEPELKVVETKVKSVKPVGEKLIYGLTVEDHSYITDSIISHNTPLWFSKRVIAKKAFNKERFLSNERYQKNLDRDIYVKFNGFIGSTFMEQGLIDLGRSLTPWLHRNFVVKNHVCYALNSAIKDKAFDEMKEMIVSDKFWDERHPDKTITPFHRIRLELQGALISSARSLLENVHSHEHRSSIRCLYTYEGCKTVCGKNDMVKQPHIEYGDVEIIDGERVGQQIGILLGCDSCKSDEERVNEHLKRPIYNHEVNVDDLRAQFLGANFTKYRFVIERKSGGFKELNPANTAYMGIAALLRNSDTLLDNFYEVFDYTNRRQTEPGMPFNASGRIIVDTVFRDEVFKEIQNTIEKANKELLTMQIRNVYKINASDTLKPDDLILYRFTTNLSYSNLLSDCTIYNGEMEVMKMDLYEKIIDTTLTTPIIAPKEGLTVGYFTLPTKYNPFIYLTNLVKHKTVGKQESRQLFDVQVLDVLRESSLTCKCGNFTLVSLSTNNVFSCKSCIVKQLLKKEIK